MRFKRDETFGLVMDTTERAALQELAELDGLSQAAVVRKLVRSAARDRGLWPPTQQPPARRTAQPAAA